MRGDADPKPTLRVPSNDPPDRGIRESAALLAYPERIAWPPEQSWASEIKIGGKIRVPVIALERMLEKAAKEV